MKLSVISAALLALATAGVQAAPVASNLTAGFSFQQYTGTTAVGNGAVGTNNILYFVEEKEVDGLKSWLIFFDPDATQRVQATLTFDGLLSQIGTTAVGLNLSTAKYGIDIDGDSVMNDYNFTQGAGLETAGDFLDDLTWIAGTNSLTLDFRANTPGDHIRVLLRTGNDVPEPASWGLAGVALAALAGSQLRRRRKG